MKRYVWILFYVVIFALIFAFSTTAGNYDFDLWARLIAGMGVIEGHQVLKTDFLSYSPTHIWYDHEWGSGVVFYFFLKYFGPFSLIILQSILVWGIFFIISKIVKLYSEKPYNILFYVFAIYAFLENFNQPIRCHLFSFFFFALYLLIFEHVRRRKEKLLFLIPFLTVIWNNLHGGVTSGLGLLVMFAFCCLLNDYKNKLWLKFLITSVVSFVALIINPWGVEYIKFLLMANTMARVNVVEWWGLFSQFHLFQKIPFKIFMFLLLVSESSCVFNKIKEQGFKEFYLKTDKVKWIMLLSTMYLAIKHVKLVPFFIMAGFVYCYSDIENILSRINLPKYYEKLVYALLLFFLIFTFSVKEISIPLTIDGLYPVREVEFIKINNLKGKLLANFGIGSYISYKLYPNNKIFMDGRYEEVYPEANLTMLKNFHIAAVNWDEILIKYPPDIIIVEKVYYAYKMLQLQQDWVEIFDGGRYAVFIRAKDLKKSYIIPTKDLNYYKNTLFGTDVKF